MLQIDSVNVLQRAHYMPLFSRMGPYDTDLLRRASEQPPRDGWWSTGPTSPPSCRSTSGRSCAPGWSATAAQGHEWSAVRHDPELVGSLLAEMRERGASTARDLDDGLPRVKEHWGWNWSETKRTLEYLFTAGELAVAGRNQHFERLYDLPERVLPRELARGADPHRG